MRAPAEVASPDESEVFPLATHLYAHEGLPILDWQAATAWAERISPTAPSAALTHAKRGWLLHLRDALGGSYELKETSCALMLSSLAGRAATDMLDFIARTRRRIDATLPGLAQRKDGDHEVLIVFSDDDAYYRYVTHAYPEEGEFAFSSGMFLHAGCPHFVTMHAETQTVERVIAHEMTHASLAYLPIPLWLNEGLAVNTENRLMGTLPKLYSPAEMREKHRAFWTRDTIQEFWSGTSFQRPDEGNLLSYDLAQILVEIMAGNWERFRSFAAAATFKDAGANAAREYLQMDLGESLAAMFEESSLGWQPDPQRWQGSVATDPE